MESDTAPLTPVPCESALCENRVSSDVENGSRDGWDVSRRSVNESTSALDVS